MHINDEIEFGKYELLLFTKFKFEMITRQEKCFARVKNLIQSQSEAFRTPLLFCCAWGYEEGLKLFYISKFF